MNRESLSLVFMVVSMQGVHPFKVHYRALCIVSDNKSNEELSIA